MRAPRGIAPARAPCDESSKPRRARLLNVLTLYAFSADNWSRPAQEVASLMRLLKRYLVSETARCLENGVRLSVIGRRDRLSADLVRTIENTEQFTAGGDGLQLRLAIDYSARESIARAASLMRGRSARKASSSAAWRTP